MALLRFRHRFLWALLAVSGLACSEDDPPGGPAEPDFGSVMIAGDLQVPTVFEPHGFDGDEEIWVFQQGDDFYITVFATIALDVAQITVQLGGLAWEATGFPVQGTTLVGRTVVFSDVEVPELPPVAKRGRRTTLTLNGSLTRPEL